MYVGVHAECPHAFLILVLGEGKWPSSSSNHVSTKESIPVTHRIGGLVGPLRGMDTAVEEINCYCPCRRRSPHHYPTQTKIRVHNTKRQWEYNCTCRTASVILSFYHPPMQSWVFLKYDVLSFKQSYGKKSTWRPIYSLALIILLILREKKPSSS